MNRTLGYLLLLGASLVVGYLIGRMMAHGSVDRRYSLLLVLVGALAFLIGQVEAASDRRFRFLAIGGLGLQIAGSVGSLGRKKRLRKTSADLWASHPPR